ncbi:connectin [Agrilus planipennis]|uniref:Connectin n=1 Tax=Agrilus planipennis TaxID=224129 RepID=A0A7F5RAD4_AGRPL|nr:connectin [Agrilus planipennis]
MKYSTRLIVVLYILASLSSTCLSIKTRKAKEPKREKNNTHQVGFSNLCTIEDNTAAFRCFCHGGTAPGNVTNTECWIFGSLAKDHEVWFLFSSQPRLTELKIIVRPDGQLGFIPTKALEYLKDLKRLMISYGNVDVIHPYAFANLTELRELTLPRSQIANLDHHAVAHLPNLTEINFNENRIYQLQKDVFVDLPNLQKLTINHNNLSFIQEGAFRYLSHLVELEMKDNFITVLTKDTFTGLSELKRLDLSFNNISRLGDLTFAELWVLEELILERNDIEFISDRAFAGLTHLRKLDLGHNNLTTLVNNVFDGIPAIYFLDLRYNHLQTITFENARPIMHNLRNRTTYFYIQDNDFVCDCRLKWMYGLYNETKSDRVKEVLKDLTCYLEDIQEETYDNNDDNYVFDDNYVTASIEELRDPFIRRLLHIPPNELPCPQKIKNPTEIPRYPDKTPAYAEINSIGRCSTTSLLPLFIYAIATTVDRIIT